MHVLLLLSMLALQAPGASSGPAAGHDAVAEAYYLFLQGQSIDADDLAAAAERYRAALALAPTAAGIRAELAGVYAQQGDLTRAREEAERALADDSSSRSAHRLLGLILASTLDRSTTATPDDPVVRSAIDHLERSTEGVRDPGVVLALGELYQRAARYDRAIVVLEQFLIDQPRSPQAVMLLVQAYRASGQPERAEALIRELRGEAPTSPAARIRAIEALEAQNEWAQAASAWAELVAQQPGQVVYRLRHAAALVNAGDLDAGRTVLEQLARETPDDVRPWYLLTQVEQRAGRSEAAEAAARRIVEIDPADGRGPLAVATVLAQRDDHRGVVAVLRPRVAAPTEADLGNGMFVRMATMLSDAWVAIGEPRQGIRTLEDARRRLPADADLLFNLAATYERDDQATRAEEIFRQILAADPDHAPALNYLGYMLADRGRKLPEALSFIERAIAVAGENPAYLDSLGWAYYRMSRFEEAVGPLERAASGAPDASVIHDHLGDAYMKLGRYVQATAAFDRALSGDRDGIDERAIIRKRDRARSAAGRQ